MYCPEETLAETLPDYSITRNSNTKVTGQWSLCSHTDMVCFYSNSNQYVLVYTIVINGINLSIAAVTLVFRNRFEKILKRKGVLHLYETAGVTVWARIESQLLRE